MVIETPAAPPFAMTRVPADEALTPNFTDEEATSVARSRFPEASPGAPFPIAKLAAPSREIPVSGVPAVSPSQGATWVSVMSPVRPAHGVDVAGGVGGVTPPLGLVPPPVVVAPPVPTFGPPDFPRPVRRKAP